MTYQQLMDFDRSLMKNEGGQGVYLGHLQDLKRQGLIAPPRKFSKMKLQQTLKTWRACRMCATTGVQAGKHITGAITAKRCKHCNGTRMVFG